MNTETLMQLSPHELNESINRLLLTVDELRYCFDSLNEEKDELLSTNMMYRETLQNLLYPPTKNLSDSIIGSVKKFWESPASKWKDTMKRIVQDPISETDSLITKPHSPRLKFLHIDPLLDEAPAETPFSLNNLFSSSRNKPITPQKKMETTYIPRNFKDTNSIVKY